MSELWKLFSALGDPHRLAMVSRLVQRGPLTISQLCADLPFTRQAGAKQVGVLAKAGIVTVQKSGRERIVALEPSQVRIANLYLHQLESVWDDRLAELHHLLESSDRKA